MISLSSNTHTRISIGPPMTSSSSASSSSSSALSSSQHQAGGNGDQVNRFHPEETEAPHHPSAHPSANVYQHQQIQRQQPYQQQYSQGTLPPSSGGYSNQHPPPSQYYPHHSFHPSHDAEPQPSTHMGDGHSYTHPLQTTTALDRYVSHQQRLSGAEGTGTPNPTNNNNNNNNNNLEEQHQQYRHHTVQRVIQYLINKEVPSAKPPTAEELFQTILYLSLPRNSKLLHDVRVTGAPPLKSNSIYLLIGRASSSKYTPKLGGRRQSTRYSSEDGCTLHYRDSSVLRTDDLIPIVVREYQLLPPPSFNENISSSSSSTTSSSSSSSSASSSSTAASSDSSTSGSKSEPSSSSSPSSKKSLSSTSSRGQKRSPPRLLLSSHLYTPPSPNLNQQQQQWSPNAPVRAADNLRSTPQVALLLRILICRPATTIEGGGGGGGGGEYSFAPFSPTSAYSPPSPRSSFQSPSHLPPPLTLEAQESAGVPPTNPQTSNSTLDDQALLLHETERALEEESRGKRLKAFHPLHSAEIKAEKRSENDYAYRLDREKVEEEKRVLHGLLREKEAEMHWLQRRLMSLQGETELVRKKLEELEQQQVHSWFA